MPHKRKPKQSVAEKKVVQRCWQGTEGWKLTVRDLVGWRCVLPNHIEMEVKPATHGLGCFVQTMIEAPQTLLGVYPGHIITEEQLQRKLSLLNDTQRKSVQRYLCQSLLHSEDQVKRYLDPTDTLGNIESSWQKNPALYCNEPDTGQKPTACCVWNYTSQRLEQWSLQPLQKGQEILISYGHSYARDYDAVTDAVYVYKNGVLSTL